MVDRLVCSPILNIFPLAIQFVRALALTNLQGATTKMLRKIIKSFSQ